MLNNLKNAWPVDINDTKEGEVSWALGNGFNLRFLIHYVGDVHQPLHATSRYTQDYPNGDAGGNLYPLADMGNIDELHALWDSVIFKYYDDIKQPLSDDDWNFLG